ncbi:MAG: ABC transporter ATP-binding protein/permease [Dialister invisus]|uniref:ABC transporter ATP-binding protein/permease n=1 Tax=Dialister invisus TaxID=218538 RepID=UPI00399C40D9
MKSGYWTREFIVGLFHLITPYWNSEEKKSARLYLAAIITLTIAAVYMTLLLNEWFNSFYSALQNYDSDAVYRGLLRFTGLAFAHIAFAVYSYYLQQRLALRWRKWMTKNYLAKWTGQQMYYRLEMFSQGTADNPDQRISEDINLFTARTLSFMSGLLRSATTIVCFIFVLWNLSEVLSFSAAGQEIHIYGYLVWTALAYSVLGTWITHKVGHRLVSLNYLQQKLEADFRFSMVRLRETAESVAFYNGAAKEEAFLSNRFMTLLRNTLFIIKKQKQLSWLTNSYAQIAIIFPFVVAVPRYLSQNISLGGLMQIANCFGKVQDAMSYFVDVYASLAEWQSCAERLLSFDKHIAAIEKETEEKSGSLVREETHDRLRLADVTISVPAMDENKRTREIISSASCTIKSGEHVILKGPSGSGKSTLLRTLAGFWPYVKGHISMPAPSEIMFIPQKPYIPMGTSAEAASYPLETADEEILSPLLVECGLSHLMEKTDTEADWSHILSLGEQQKLAFVRVFLRKPKWVFLDEATSAMDEETEEKMYRLLTALPGTTVISIGHRSTLDKWHNRVLRIENGKLIG